MDADFLYFVAIGIIAQLVDGALGMAYGVISTSFLLSLGLTPVSASASVHAAEIVTTGISGLSHVYHRNVEWRILLRLTVPACVGAIFGALFLTQAPSDIIRPIIAFYLMIMGALILRGVFVRATKPKVGAPRRLAPLGFAGGLLDAIGGGGWGPIVSSTLIARGSTPRYVIGSVNLAEFFVTAAASAVFISSVGLEYGTIVLGLLTGGAIAAPFAGFLAKRLPARVMMVLVAVLVIGLSLHTIWSAIGTIWPR